MLDKNNADVYAYTRTGNVEKLLILLNFTAHKAMANINVDVKNATLLLSNYTTAPAVTVATVTLQPYEAIIYKLKDSK